MRSRARYPIEIYNLFNFYFKEKFSSYDVLYGSLFEIMDKGLFDEFEIDIMISKLNSNVEIKTINRILFID